MCRKMYKNTIVKDNLNDIKKYICEDNRCCIMRANPAIEHIFSELYHVRKQRKLGYMKIKTLELLLFVSDIDTVGKILPIDYYSQNQVRRVNDVEAYITFSARKTCLSKYLRHDKVRLHKKSILAGFIQPR